jgi:hypothetical protein
MKRWTVTTPAIPAQARRTLQRAIFYGSLARTRLRLIGRRLVWARTARRQRATVGQILRQFPGLRPEAARLRREARQQVAVIARREAAYLDPLGLRPLPGGTHGTAQA